MSLEGNAFGRNLGAFFERRGEEVFKEKKKFASWVEVFRFIDSDEEDSGRREVFAGMKKIFKGLHGW